MTVLRHALCGDDFDQPSVSMIFRETVRSVFFFLGGGDAIQVQYSRQGKKLHLLCGYHVPGTSTRSHIVETPAFVLMESCCHSSLS